MSSYPLLHFHDRPDRLDSFVQAYHHCRQSRIRPKHHIFKFENTMLIASKLISCVRLGAGGVACLTSSPSGRLTTPQSSEAAMVIGWISIFKKYILIWCSTLCLPLLETSDDPAAQCGLRQDASTWSALKTTEVDGNIGPRKLKLEKQFPR